MLVNPTLSEKENLLNHLNQVLYDEMGLDEVGFSLPTVIKEEPDVDPVSYKEYDLNTINTQVIATPINSGLDRWRGSKAFQYRRLHVGVQFRLCKRNLSPGSGWDWFLIRTRYRIRGADDERIDQEIKKTLAKVGLRVDSIRYEVLKFEFDEYGGYPVIKVRITPIENSLIYVGDMVFTLEVFPENIYLPGFKPYRP